MKRTVDAARSAIGFVVHPLSVLWVLIVVAVVGGLVDWVIFDGLPWAGFGAAGVLVGVTKLVAHVKGIPALPWEKSNVKALNQSETDA